jgi:hypothetical protein
MLQALVVYFSSGAHVFSISQLPTAALAGGAEALDARTINPGPCALNLS